MLYHQICTIYTYANHHSIILQAIYSDSYLVQWFRTNGKAAHALTPPTTTRGPSTSSAYVPSPDDVGFFLVLRCTPRRCISPGSLSDTDGKEPKHVYGRAMEFVTTYQTVAVYPGYVYGQMDARHNPRPNAQRSMCLLDHSTHTEPDSQTEKFPLRLEQ